MDIARNRVLTALYDQKKGRPELESAATFPHIDYCLHRGVKFQVLDNQLSRFSQHRTPLRFARLWCRWPLSLLFVLNTNDCRSEIKKTLPESGSH